jgi:chromosome segregation ATPase
MSAMQRQNIPELQQGFERASGLSGGNLFNRYEGAPNLALTEDVARDYLKPKLEAQSKIEQRTAEEESIKAQIARDIAKHKAGTKHALEVAELDLKEAKEKLNESRKHIASQKAPETPKTSANEARENARQENKIKTLEQRKAELQGELSRRAPRLGAGAFDEYSNTYPMGNGAGDLNYAHQLLQGIGNDKIDANSKALFKQELEKLQAKNPKLLPTIQQYYGR